ncbi:MAG: hypothetical protein GFH27_549309n19 [Chloroflexi bacterium AL-W]|nr:hypothetical protein [Chloroflexi bacterium AL-N1]NOK69722.1 hypothetical protein [Chloroflexi bacterium AL-N10]NOK73674.1 hypothetical protein [Chloroflexi bacterium AL-N5]NOK83892.1 hypothetical protein [Chloroflexi bacterium AL-W]NOK88005.1 hypothetical protein [Chloroflexi bacterium AL-N15]
MLLFLGVLFAIGAAGFFIAVGVFSVVGAADTTQKQLKPGFLPDNPGGLERVLTFVSIWVSIILVTVLSVWAGIEFLFMAIRALS